jgi:hypothetical protein
MTKGRYMTNQSKSTYAQQEFKGNKNLALYTTIWLISTALLAFGPKLIWDFSIALTVVAIVLNIIAGGLLILANVKYVKCLDELGRKVFLESATITLGVLMVFGVAYELIFVTGAIGEFEPRISHLYFVIGITFIVSTFLGHRKYR